MDSILNCKRATKVRQMLVRLATLIGSSPSDETLQTHLNANIVQNYNNHRLSPCTY